MRWSRSTYWLVGIVLAVLWGGVRSTCEHERGRGPEHPALTRYKKAALQHAVRRNVDNPPERQTIPE